MINQIPILLIVFPLIGGCLMLLLRSKYSWEMSLFMVMLNIFGMIYFSLKTSKLEVSYILGDWALPLGIELKMNSLSLLFIMVLSFILFITILYSHKLIDHYIDEKKKVIFFSLLIFTYVGYLGVILTNDAFNLYVFMEIANIACFGLAMSGNSRFVSYTAFKFLTISIISASLILIGIGFIYSATGYLNFSKIYEVIDKLNDKSLPAAGLLFIFFGCMLKLSIFPIQQWVNNLYQNTSVIFASYLSAVSGFIIMIILLKFIYSTNLLYHFQDSFISKVMTVIASISIVICSIAALCQKKILAVFGYSSAAHNSLILLLLSIMTRESIFAAFLLMIFDSFNKLALFQISGIMTKKIGSENIQDLDGIFKTMPYLSIFLILNLLSLVGAPLFAGFIGKLFAIIALSKHNLLTIIPVVALSVVSLIYSLKIIETICYTPQGETKIYDTAIPISAKLAIMISTTLTLMFGIYTSFTINTVDNIAKRLFE